MKALILAVVAYCSNGLADEWRCTETASEKNGTSFYACGVGEGVDEAQARKTAFDNAEDEFWNTCNTSADCKYHFTDVSPGRTTCSRTNTGIKCYRLIVYSILENKMPIYAWHRPYHVSPASTGHYDYSIK